MEILNLPLAAGVTQQFRRGGVGFEILSSSGAINVNFYSNNGGQTNTMQGVLSGMFMNTAFGGFDIVSATTQTVQIAVFDAGENGGSRRMALSGSVTVLDQGQVETAAGQCFMGSTIMTSGAGSSFGTSILYNAGTKTVYVDKLAIQTGGTNTAMFVGMTTTGAPAVGAQLTGLNYNKDVNGAAATAQLWQHTQNVTKWTPTKKIFTFSSGSTTLGGGLKFPLIDAAKPLRVLPGQSVGVAFDIGDGGNQSQAWWEWREL